MLEGGSVWACHEGQYAALMPQYGGGGEGREGDISGGAL